MRAPKLEISEETSSRGNKKIKEYVSKMLENRLGVKVTFVCDRHKWPEYFVSSSVLLYGLSIAEVA